MIGILLTLFLCSRLGQCIQPTMDPVMAQYIGDHGDRISDLESLVQTLASGSAYFQRELDKATADNLQLQSRIQVLEASCFNNSHACCTQCSSSTSGSPQTIVPTFNTTTSNHGNLASQTTNSTSVYNMATATTSGQAATTTETTTMATSPPQPGFSSCKEATNGRTNTSGVFNIIVGSSTIPVFCDGEWMVIQRRVDGSEDFNRNWQDYAQGFGDLRKEFWLGNEHISRITTSTDHVLHISFGDWGGNWQRSAQYEHFRVLDSSYNYRLYVGPYSGEVGDSFHYPDSPLLQHHTMAFSTPDRDNDQSSLNCAKLLSAGWWFNDCYSSNLNGLYLPSAYGQRMMGESFGQPTTEGTGIEWYPYRRRQYSMRNVAMKIKPLSTSHVMIG